MVLGTINDDGFWKGTWIVFVMLLKRKQACDGNLEY